MTVEELVMILFQYTGNTEVKLLTDKGIISFDDLDVNYETCEGNEFILIGS